MWNDCSFYVKWKTHVKWMYWGSHDSLYQNNECCLYQTEKLNEMPIVYIRGFQHFGTHLHPNQNCTALRTPISELYPLGVAPNKKCYSNKLVFWGIFKIWCTLWASRVALGVRIPQVENHWSISNRTIKWLPNGKLKW